MAETESEYYKSSTRNMGLSGRYKLANMMAHGYSLIHSVSGVIVVRDNVKYLIENNGNVWKLEATVGCKI